jgi:tetratricopeptide (TPR) repeat protein
MIKVVAMAAVAVLLAGTSAAAQGEPPTGRDAQARGLFEAAKAAFAEGRFGDALRYFQEAHELSGRPELLFNIGNAAERARRDDIALSAYRRFLEELPDAPNEAFVRERIRFLEGSGGKPGASVETSDEGDDPAAARAGDSRPPTPAEAARAELVPTAPGEELAPHAPVDRAERRGGIASRWWFWTIVGVAVAGAAAGLAIALSGKDTVYQTEDPIPGNVGDGGVIHALRWGP